MEPIQTRTQSKPLKWAVVIGIVVVLNLFFNYAISLVSPAPEYSNFCKDEQVNTQPATKAECLAIGGQWNQTATPQSVAPGVTVKPTTPDTQTYCNTTFTCQKNYDAVNKSYDKNIFITLVILGVVSIVVGLFWKTTEAVSIGLSFGGVLSLVIASMRYWSQAENLLKVIILAIALIALLYVGVKKFQQ